MHTYVLLYNRLTSQNVGPEVPPATVTGPNPATALKEVFGYAFKRVYGEAAKSPDIVVVEGTMSADGVLDATNPRAGRMKFIATKKVAQEVKHSAISHRKEKDPKTHRYIKRKT